MHSQEWNEISTVAMRFPGFNVIDSRITQNLIFSATASKPGQARAIASFSIAQRSHRINASKRSLGNEMCIHNKTFSIDYVATTPNWTGTIN